MWGFFLLFFKQCVKIKNGDIMKVKEILNEISNKLKNAGVEEPILKARMLMEYKLKIAKGKLALHLEDDVQIDLEDDLSKLVKGIPIQYITHLQSFYGLDFYINSDVLIPQPDTEILVDEVVKLIENKNLNVLDICTGSGAIAISIAKNTNAKVVASDISESALEVARKNAILNDVNVNFVQSDLFENICQKFDIIVSNPPYIETETLKILPKEVQNEPIIALNGGKDGLEFYRKISKNAGKYLNYGGILAVEIGYNQKEEVTKIMEKSGFCEIICKKDFAGNDRVVIGKGV